MFTAQQPSGRSFPKRRAAVVVVVVSLLASMMALPMLESEAQTGLGVLSVSTAPPLPSAIAVDGTVRNIGTVEALELPAGDYAVSFGGVQGYLPPATQMVTVDAGSTVALVGSFTQAGQLNIATEPADLQPSIFVDDIERDRGSTSLAVPIGSSQICGGEAEGHVTPDCVEVDVSQNGATDVTLTYERVREGDDLPREDGHAIAFWDFTDGEGTTVTDRIGDNHLTISDGDAVTWSSTGLTFKEPAIARTSGPPASIYDAILDSQEFTVEAWITPSNASQSGPSRIVSISKDTGSQNLLLGQGGLPDTYGDVVTYRSHERTGAWQQSTPRGSLSNQMTHVAVTRTADGTARIYLDGELASQETMAKNLAWDTSFTLALGNEMDLSRPWLGTYHLVALHDAPLTADDIRTNFTAGANSTSDDIVSPEPEPIEPDPQERPEPVEPNPAPEPGATTAELMQHDITWTFDGDYEYGVYANGDYWVVGPVTITSIDPMSVSGDRVMHGSMINPSPQQHEIGYGHIRANTYDSALNVALDISPSSPLEVPVHSSLVSTISVEEANARPGIETAAVLTVVDEPPPPNSFRPAYSGNDKSAKHNAADLQYELLPQLPRISSTPDIRETAHRFERVWLDHKSGWTGRKIHPRTSMPDYGRNLAALLGQGSLMLMLDFTDADKEQLLINYVQIGIDFYGIVEEGGSWHPDGGHAQGRKWPILFAGTILGDDDMAAIGSHPDVMFGEDAQTFYVSQVDVDRGVGYEQSDLGLAEYGIRHATDPSRDDAGWESSYRRCCTANSWHGHVLSARMMGLQEAWNHDPLFDYTDRYMATEKPGTWYRSWQRPFSDEMWDVYRPTL